jgi:hypothetical protein
MPTNGGKFGIRSNKTLRRVNPNDRVNDIDEFVVNHCQETEGEVLFGDSKNMKLKTNLAYEEIDKSERKRLHNRNKSHDSNEDDEEDKKYGGSEDEDEYDEEKLAE